MNFKQFTESGEHIDLSKRTQIKTDELIGNVVTIKDYTFIKTKNGESAIVIFDEYSDKFWFANNVVCQVFHRIDNAGAKEQLQTEGMKVLFSKKKNKAGTKEYTNIEAVE